MHVRKHLHLNIAPITPADQDTDREASVNRRNQLYFNLSYKVKHQAYVAYSDGRPRVSLGFFNDARYTLTKSFSMDSELFTSHPMSTIYLSAMFSRVKIDSSFHEELVEKITERVSSLITNGNFLVFDFKILKHCMYMFQEQEVTNHVMRQSRLEYENENCGMVPTAPNSRRLKRMEVGAADQGGIIETPDANDGRENKKRRVSKREICTVCLEEIEDIASEMPCGHLFHGNCIDKWLESSHYCPLCRYEMPT